MRIAQFRAKNKGQAVIQKPPKKIQITLLDGGEHHIVLPIDAWWFQKGENEFVCWADKVEVFGAGANPGDAVQDLKKKLVEKHIELQGVPASSLPDRERGWREYLEDHIKEKKRRKPEWEY